MAQVVLENIYKTFSSSIRVQANRHRLESDDHEQVSISEGLMSSGAVLRRINLTINDGEFMVLVGPSGCGKSTLLRLIAGLESLTGGNIWIGEALVNGLPPKARDIAMVFQNYALYPHLKVYDNLAFGLRRMGERLGENQDLISENNQDFSSMLKRFGEEALGVITRSLKPGLRYRSAQEKAIAARVFAVARLLQIELLLERYPKQLSGGQKQRVALGRAMARNPQVFLMDEPLSNLDAKLRTETRAQIVELQRQLGTTTIYVTHDQTEAMTMGSRIAVMNRGQIQQVATPLELYNRPANQFVAEFIGSPPMNFLTVQFSAPLLIVHPLFRLTLPERWGFNLKAYQQQSLILGVRPEHLKISCAAPRNLPVQVERIESLGHETLLSVRPYSRENGAFSLLQLRVPGEVSVSLGEKIWMAIAIDHIHLFDSQTEQAIFPR
ncbi:ABC transporter ATP-binding protein [Lyngbya sp. PCC 8106]|uniref:ABC transporter ATP-binding protein n=1 Tax=Lyngbya sp. (strain PCC 8106) TaxID=313612 RepID=UPI0000EACDCF|nr:ATP-binding cassette domain-containing protein [Lyngbya sp. PCC 8106]EAW35478.1 ATP-binding protein of sugar ABC transporter [Lyngbya sp. PCC 8106]